MRDSNGGSLEWPGTLEENQISGMAEQGSFQPS